MYEITRRLQRHRQQTEFLVNYSSLPENVIRAQKYYPLARFDESLFQPEAELVLDELADYEILWIILDGSMGFQVDDSDFCIVEKNQVCRARVDSESVVRMKNPTEREARFLEVWIHLDTPLENGIQISDCRFYPDQPRFLTIASGQDHPDTVALSRDLAVYYFLLEQNESFIFETTQHRSCYIWIVKGALSIEDFRILNQDGVILAGESRLTLNAQRYTRAILIDFPGPESETLVSE